MRTSVDRSLRTRAFMVAGLAGVGVGMIYGFLQPAAHQAIGFFSGVAATSVAGLSLLVLAVLWTGGSALFVTLPLPSDGFLNWAAVVAVMTTAFISLVYQGGAWMTLDSGRWAGSWASLPTFGAGALVCVFFLRTAKSLVEETRGRSREGAGSPLGVQTTRFAVHATNAWISIPAVFTLAVTEGWWFLSPLLYGEADLESLPYEVTAELYLFLGKALLLAWVATVLITSATGATSNGAAKLFLLAGVGYMVYVLVVGESASMMSWLWPIGGYLLGHAIDGGRRRGQKGRVA